MIRALAVAALALAPPAVAAGARLEPESRLVWSAPVPGFGGFSGIEVLEGGAALVAIGDQGTWVRAAMRREGGRLVGIDLRDHGRLRAISGAPLEGADADAEGLAVDAAGRFWVSFEGFHRVRRYDRIEGPATDAPSHPDFRRLQNNSGLEALAIDAGGVVHAIPERSGAWERPFPVYRLRGGVWDRDLALRRDGTFLVAGADFGPDGKLYLLERDFRRFGGFATRVRRFTPGPEGFRAEETLLETGFGSTDNFEGISVWADAAGVVRATLIADDNFFALQSTVVAEYRLVEG